MWYVIQVGARQEERVRALIQAQVSEDLYDEVFVPKTETMRRWRGQWVLREDHFIPGYLFVITKDPGKLADALRAVPAFARLLGNSDYFTPLTDAEAKLVDAFTDKEHRVIAMSQGVIEGDEVRVLKGPLMHQTGLIKRIDRHKRLAYLEITILGRRKQVPVGLEIVAKG